MVTIANKSAPGLWAARGTWYYRSIIDELEQLEEVSRRLELPRDESIYPSNLKDVTAANVQAMLKLVKTKRPNGDESDFLADESSATAKIDYAAIATKVKVNAK